jgi:hypothetical protein
VPLPDDLHDESRNYRIRMCIKVAENPVVGFITGSKVHLCDSCADPIWVDEKQALPDPPEGIVIDGDIKVCMDCLLISQRDDDQPVSWI